MGSEIELQVALTAGAQEKRVHMDSDDAGRL